MGKPKQILMSFLQCSAICKSCKRCSFRARYMGHCGVHVNKRNRENKLKSSLIEDAARAEELIPYDELERHALEKAQR